MRVILVARYAPNNIKNCISILPDDVIIGIDAGALVAIKQGLKLTLAIGDFDSVNSSEYELIRKNVLKVTKLNPIKDDTDVEVALKYALSLSDDVVLLGGINGKRVEHFYANIQLLKRFPTVQMVDDNSRIYTLSPGRYEVFDDEYHYISLFAISTVSALNLKNFKYELVNYHLKEEDVIGISNETKGMSIIDFADGRLLVIKTKKDA